jgi:biotin carboxylase
MMKTLQKNGKDTILIVGGIAASVLENLRKFKKENGKDLKFLLLHDKKKLTEHQQQVYSFFDYIHYVNFDSATALIEVLRPYEDRLLAVTCRAESHIPNFEKIIPYLPYLKTPTAQSLEWSTNKIQMRRRFKAYDPSITPKYCIATDSTKATIEKIEKKVGYPLIIKPSGLAQSLLVTPAYHRDELKKSLQRVFRTINRLYRETNGRGEPQVLVEEFMEGKMYSVDAYVTSRGKVYFCPLVYIKTGREIGFDDFFGYQQMTPTILSKKSIEEAQSVSIKAIHALGLRSSTAHVELMQTEKGWKVIELGPRVGGFRNTMYALSYNIDHTANDIYIHIPKKLIIPKKIQGYTAALKIFAKKEGKITKLTGIKKAQELKSFHDILINKKVGDRAIYAKNGGKSIFNITLFNKDRSELLADIRRLEQSVKIETK